MFLPEVRNFLILPTNAHYLIKLPANNTLSFISLFEDICKETKLLGIPYGDDYTNIHNGKLGVYLSHPALRLITAYEQQNSLTKNNTSFKEYYSNPIRLNFYTRYFEKNQLNGLGFIGISEYPMKSLVIAHSWMKLPMGRFAYHKLAKLKNNPSETGYYGIDKHEFDEIEKLHADDFKLYKSVLSELEKKWATFIHEYKINIPSNKKVYIHVGPPKTGTSAIQYWFNKHSKELLSEGVLYPEHSLDANKVSSGNVNQLVSIANDQKSLYFDVFKTRKLLASLKHGKSDIMLFSSEHFYYFLLWLFTCLPDAIYIFYIRHPLSALQSGYNQEIKRHKRTQPFVLPKNINFAHLEILYIIASEFNVDIRCRPYDKNMFINGSIIDDVLSCVDKSLSLKTSSAEINSQYSFEAMEFMRAANNFATDPTLIELDLFLQEYSVGKPKFSCISPNDVKLHNELLLKDTDHLLEFFSISKEQMRTVLENFKVTDEMYKIFNQQPDFNDIIQTLKKKKRTLFEQLGRELIKTGVADDHLELSAFVESKFEKLTSRLRNIGRPH